MKKLSVLSIALAVSLSVGLSACGGTNSANTTTAGTTGAPGAASTTAAGSTAAEATVDPLAKYEPAITVTYPRQTNTEQKFLEGESYDNNVWTREYESELGIKVSAAYEVPDSDTYDTKLNLAIATNQLPDIFRISNLGQLQTLEKGNMVEDLTQVIDKYTTPFVKETMAQDKGAAYKQCTINGKIVAYPVGPIKEDEMQYFYVRDDLRKALGKEEPKTFEDLVELGKAFVQSGKIKTAFGFCSNPYDSFMSMLGVFNAYSAYPTAWIEKDGKLVYGGVQPEMKTALTALNQMYKDKLISKEFVVKDSQAAYPDVIAGDVGIVSAQWWFLGWPLPDAWKKDHNVDWRAYPVLFSKDAGQKMVLSRANAVARNSGTMCVRKGYEHPEAVAKLHDYFMEKSYGATSDEKKYRIDGPVTLLSLAVVQGGLAFNNLSIAKNVTLAIDNKDESYLKTNEEREKYKQVVGFMDGTLTDEGSMTAVKDYYGPQSLFAIEQNYRDYKMLLMDQFYGSETPEMLKKMPILKKNETEMVIKIVSGASPIEEFDKFVKSWNDLGGAKITEEVNAWKASLGK